VVRQSRGGQLCCFSAAAREVDSIEPRSRDRNEREAVVSREIVFVESPSNVGYKRECRAVWATKVGSNKDR
jgi:hypothetical protein